jgi:hypothetical protein
MVLIALVPPIEDVAEFAELSLDSLPIDLLSRRLLMGDLPVMVERLLVLRRRRCGPLDALVRWPRRWSVRCCGFDISTVTLHRVLLARQLPVVRPTARAVSPCRFGGCPPAFEHVE